MIVDLVQRIGLKYCLIGAFERKSPRRLPFIYLNAERVERNIIHSHQDKLVVGILVGSAN